MEKTSLYINVFKSMFSTQDERIRSIADSAIETVNTKVKQQSSANVKQALEEFNQAKTDHASNMLKLENLAQEIIRNEQELRTAQEENKQAEDNWNSLFRKLRGVISPEMKAERYQQVANREMLDDFTKIKNELIDELKAERERTMENARSSGAKLIKTHHIAFSVYAENEWSIAMQDFHPSLLRAFKLRLLALQITGKDNPHFELISELGANVHTISKHYLLDIQKEPVISQLGLNRPELTGVEMEEYKSPAQLTVIWHKRRLEEERLRQEKEEQEARAKAETRL